MDIPFSKFRSIPVDELKTLFTLIPGKFGIYLFDGKTLSRYYTSEDFSALTGYALPEYTERFAKDCLQLFLSGDRLEMARTLEHSCQNETPFDVVFRINHKNSGCVWLHMSGRPLGGFEGKIALLIMFIETSLDAQGETALLDHSSDAIFLVHSKTYELLYANEKAKKLW